jgi:hypothetical protein
VSTTWGQGRIDRDDVHIESFDLADNLMLVFAERLPLPNMGAD